MLSKSCTVVKFVVITKCIIILELFFSGKFVVITKCLLILLEPFFSEIGFIFKIFFYCWLPKRLSEFSCNPSNQTFANWEEIIISFALLETWTGSSPATQLPPPTTPLLILPVIISWLWIYYLPLLPSIWPGGAGGGGEGRRRGARRRTLEQWYAQALLGKDGAWHYSRTRKSCLNWDKHI